MEKIETHNNQDINKVTAEIMEHMMNPKNYGKMDNANGVGMAVDKKTGEFAMVYVNLENNILKDITFGCNACQDTVVAGSLFTEMIKGDTLENTKRAATLMDEKLNAAPKKQQTCSRMILKAYEAALINYENRKSKNNEDMYTIDLKESCEGVNLS